MSFEMNIDGIFMHANVKMFTLKRWHPCLSFSKNDLNKKVRITLLLFFFLQLCYFYRSNGSILLAMLLLLPVGWGAERHRNKQWNQTHDCGPEEKRTQGDQSALIRWDKKIHNIHFCLIITWSARGYTPVAKSILNKFKQVHQQV